MDYKILALSELKQYSQLKSAHDNCKNRISEIEEKMIRIKGGNTENIRVQTNQYYSDSLAKIIDEKDEQVWILKTLNCKIARFEKAIASLNEEQKAILEMCYIQSGNSTEDTAWKLGMERSCFYKKKNRALECFTRALFGIVKE